MQNNEFAVVALPGSGTAWASVWLNCIHDPLDRYFPEEVAGGLCCTASWMFDIDWKRPTLVLTKPWVAGDLPDELQVIWDQYCSQHFCLPHTDLWNNPKRIWGFLFPGIPLDTLRHSRLKDMEIRRPVESLNDDEEHVQALVNRYAV